MMSQKDLYNLIDETAKSYNACFTWHTTRKWVKYFADSHWEVFAYRYLDEDLDQETYDRYKKRYMKRMVEINMAYIEECMVKHEEEEKKKQQKAKTSTKRKKDK